MAIPYPLIFSALSASPPRLRGDSVTTFKKFFNPKLIVGHVSSAEQLPHAVRTGNVDGILGYGQFPEAAVMPRLLRTPAVWMMTRSDLDPDPWGDRVLPNSKAIGALAARFLLDR